MTNEELLAASPYWFKVAPTYWSVIMVYINFFAIVQCKTNPSQQWTSRPPSYFNNTGGTAKGIMTSILPLKRPADY
jgi:hypothetical protein